MPSSLLARASVIVATALFVAPTSRCAGHHTLQAAETADTFAIMSRATGRSYKISISQPRLPAPPNGYPVIYVPADDAAFRDMVTFVQAGTKPAVIVGIGYPSGIASDKAALLDLTPSVSATPPSGSATGEAEDFLAFLEQALKPEVARRVAVDPENQTLFGRSCAGLFALYALVNAPASFSTFIALNPSIAFENRFLMEPQLRGRLGPKLQATQATPRTLLMTGEARSAAIDCPAANDALGSANTRDFHTYLQSLSGISSEMATLSGTVEWTPRAVLYALATGAPQPAPAAKLAPPGAPGGIAVPTADAYRAMTADQRYALRLRVRDLPEDQRQTWTAQFNASLSAGLTYREHRRFYEERVAMDLHHGTRSPDDR